MSLPLSFSSVAAWRSVLGDWRIRLVVAVLVLLAVAACAVVLLAPRDRGVAAVTTTATVRVETPDATVVDTLVTVPETCVITDAVGVQHTLEGGVALCALDTAATWWGFDYAVQDTDFGLFLSEVAGQSQTESLFWLYRVNGVSPMDGLADHTLAEGDELLLTFRSPATELWVMLSV